VQALAKTLADEAGQSVGNAARGEGDDQRDRLCRRISLRVRRRGGERQDQQRGRRNGAAHHSRTRHVNVSSVGTPDVVDNRIASGDRELSKQRLSLFP